jgi:hypothetical protein
MRPLLFLGLCAIVSAYPRCNDMTAQYEYLETERWMFGISSDVSPFDSETLFPNRTLFMPSACQNENGDFIQPAISNCEFIAKNTHMELQSPTNRYTGLDKYATYATDFVWRMLGWQKQIVDGEHYWYLENPNTDNIAFYLHGINGVNGLENMVLLRRLAQNASVYFSVYSPVFYLDTNYEYQHTYSEHVDNLNSFILSQMVSDDAQYDIVGNSYGTIRTTTICKRYPDTCERMTNIILTDPLNLNVPYYQMFHSALYGVFFPHPVWTPKYRKAVTIQTLRLSKYYKGLWNDMDWYEWSIDSPMIRRFANKIVLVIGLRDKHIVINRDSPVLKLCRVIYTNTRHGMCIFSDFVSSIH